MTASAFRTSPGASEAADIDPATVPVYPVLSIELDGEQGPTLNGRPVPVPESVEPEQAAVDAAARAAAEMPGGGPVRVAARTAEGRTYRMVVAGDGRVWELPDPTAPRGRPAWLWPLVAAGTALVLGTGTATAVLVTRSDPPPASTPAVTAPPTLAGPVGAGANLPLTPPPGFTGRAVWSVPLDARTEPIVTPDGTVLAVTADRRLVRLDPRTGNPTWAGQMPSGASGGELHLTTVDGQLVVAASLGRTLAYWPLPTHRDQPVPPEQTPDEPRTVALPQTGELSWSGRSPLVTLPDQTAAVVTAGTTQRLDVPVGAAALAADGTTVTAADPAGRWWQLRPGSPAGPARALPKPPGATGGPLRVLAVGSTHLAAVWPARDAQLVTLHTSTDGRAVATAQVRGTDLTRAETLAQTAGPLLTLGPVLLDPTHPAVVPLGVGITPRAVAAGHVYATQDRAWVDVAVTGSTARVQPIRTVDEPALPAGIITGPPPLALAVARKVEQRLLHALPAE